MLLYDEVVEFNKELIDATSNKYGYTEKGWKIFREYYKDPDGYPLNKEGFRCVNGIVCTADALISVNRMYEHEGFNECSKYLYAVCRDIPVFFFPREKGGINTSRYAIFGDRIDHTLYDLKRYCDGANDCKMMETYNRPKTKEWLDYFEKDFGKIVVWFGIEGLFVEMIDGEYKIYDLEKGYGFVESYLETYPKQWSQEYYSNVMDKMRQVIQKRG